MIREFLAEARHVFAQSWRAGALQKDLIAMVVMGGFIIAFSGLAAALSGAGL